MKNKWIALVVLTLALTGCGTASPQTHAHGSAVVDANASMASSHSGLSSAIEDELKGFDTITQDVGKGDYKDADPLAGQLHDEFHAVILPPLKAKKGSTYAEDIHSKYDELQDAIKAHDAVKISQLIKVNRDNLHTVAALLGVSIRSS